MPTVPRSRNGTGPSRIDNQKVDPKEAAAIQRAIQSREIAPSTAEQTGSFTDWRRLRDELGQPYDAEHIPLRKLKQMRRDSMIGFGLHYIIVPLARASWHMEAKDKNGPNAQVAAFMDAAWRMIHARFVMQRCLALSFGFQALVKRFQEANPGGLYEDPMEENPENRIKPVWDEGSVLPKIWKPFVTLRPESVEPVFNNDGEFDGMRYEMTNSQRANNRGAGSRVAGNQNQREIDVYRSLWATHDKDNVFGSLYGFPRIGHAYRFWWSYWFNWAQRDRAFERMATPPLIAYHPVGNYTDPNDPTGDPIPYQQIALLAAERLRANAVAAVPSTLASSGLEEKGTQQRDWDFKFLETPSVNFEHFNQAFNYLDVLKLRSIFVPEQAFIESPGGSGKNVAQQMADIFIESEGLLWDEMADEINRFILPQLLVLNFPEFVNNGGQCRIVGHGFATADVEMLKQLVQLIGQADPLLLGVDVREGLRQLNIPVLQSQQYQRIEEVLAQRLQGQPPTQPGGPDQVGIVEQPAEALGGATNGGSQPEPNQPGAAAAGFSLADVNPSSNYNQPQRPWNQRDAQWAQSTGFTLDAEPKTRSIYVQPNDYIHLSAESDFIAGLPSSKHYKDKAIRALAVQLRRAWAGHFRGIYTEFARFVGQADLALSDQEASDLVNEIAAEDGIPTTEAAEHVLAMAEERKTMGLRKAKKLANRLVNEFSIDSQRMLELTRSSSKTIGKLIKRAVAVELKRLNMGGEADKDAIDSFIESQTGRLIKLAHGTVKDELRDFLVARIQEGKHPAEISQEISEHFSEFPTYKANRVARSEVRDAVNAGTLISADANGLKYVRGVDGTTYDEDCAERNGKLFTVTEAWKVMYDEHPNGTLGFEPIQRAAFSIQHTRHMPDGAPENALAFYDEGTSTAFVNSWEMADNNIDDFLAVVTEHINHPELVRAGGVIPAGIAPQGSPVQV